LPAGSAGPRTGTRGPSAAVAWACARAGPPGGSSTSGAPRTQPPLAGPASVKTAPLHLRAEEKGTTWTGRHRISPLRAPASAGVLPAGFWAGTSRPDRPSAGAAPPGTSPPPPPPPRRPRLGPASGGKLLAGEHLRGRPPGGRASEPARDRLHGRVRPLLGPDQAGEDPADGHAGHQLDCLVELHPRLGQGPGLIEAQH